MFSVSHFFSFNRNLLLSSPLRPLSGHIWFELACYAGSFVNIVESLFLLLLTTVSSTENHGMFEINSCNSLGYEENPFL